MANRWGNSENSDRLYFLGLKITADGAAVKLKDACSLLEKLWPIRQHIKQQRHYFANKSLSSQSYGFSSGHEWIWELDYKESWVPKNWCFWAVVLEKTLDSPLNCKEIQQVHPKGFLNIHLKNWWWSWISNTLATWREELSHWKKSLILGKIEVRRRRGRQDEMVGWHHWLDGHEFEQALGVGDGQRSLVCCNIWGHKESDMTEWLNWTDWRNINYFNWIN